MNLARGTSSAKASAGRPRKVRRVKLVELVPTAILAKSRRYVVQVGTHAVEVDDQFDEATLRRLLAVLKSC